MVLPRASVLLGWGDFAPSGHLAVSGDSLGHHHCVAVCVPLAPGEWRPRMRYTSSQAQGRPPVPVVSGLRDAGLPLQFPSISDLNL